MFFSLILDDIDHLDSLSFDTLIPKYLLEDYICLLRTHKFLAINSIQKFGKTFLANKLIQFASKQ